MEREERIFLSYMPVRLRDPKGPTFAYHAALNYVDKHGNHHVIEAEPSRYYEIGGPVSKALSALGEEFAFSGGAKNRDSEFGRLIAYEREAEDHDRRRLFEFVFEADDLSREWSKIRETVRIANERGYEYRPYSQNSNTFVVTALKAAGLGSGSGYAYDPVRKESRRHNLPGSEFELSNPINPDGVPVKPGYENAGFVEGRIRELQGLMGNLGSEYFRSPKSRDLQAEYRNLLRARGKQREIQPMGEGISPLNMVP